LNPRVAFETLGCKLNQYETDAIAAGFRDLGWEIVGPEDPAEAYVVNTCTVTDKADRKSLSVVGHHLNRENTVVVVTGCFAESAQQTLEGTPGVTFVVPNAQKNQIPALVDGRWKGELEAPNLPAPDRFGFPVHDKVFHTRAGLKVQDGCDNFCSFCIIPTVRGRAVSLPLSSVLTTAQELVASGRKELVLTGVNLGRWTQGSLTFTDLMVALLAVPGDFRVRITSLEPDGLGDEFAGLFDHPKLCPHLHLCLQSGSPKVLLSMRREYNLEQYAAVVAALRERRPDLNLTTDLIVGFPGETDDDFQRSLDSIDAFDFGAVHVFPFSRRQGTRADRMAEQISTSVKAQRSRALHAKALEARLRKMESMIGSARRVLVETPDQGRSEGRWLRGLTEDYFPVRFHGQVAWNTFAPIRLDSVVREGEDFVFESTWRPRS